MISFYHSSLVNRPTLILMHVPKHTAKSKAATTNYHRVRALLAKLDVKGQVQR